MAKHPKTRPSSPSADKLLAPEVAVILYNKQTGVICHVHFFSATNGIKPPDKKELEDMASAHAVKDGHDIQMHGAMHIAPAALKRGVGYRISVKKRAPSLVEIKPGKLKPHNILGDA
ncbi:hypothetical protein [Roseimicrobium sp. ORNL1]|uniref:hypothetical protein n=1 Tax=Roseimicrobium sp. ORNL1 TaxID=2711231 RepID=UPI0013E1F783|nr:hypothetical protein [Roseimicrobium sp. ORNL1]QIF04622.1 hypothetical protein G5S37_24865 [Roseimicrobium sp. ORNL1]